ncbi:MAG: hypothetical protein ACFE9Q_11265 [Candidatus Hodarchaeota archaeon]
MKGLCYIVLILGFFIFYQQNPLYAIIIIVLFIGLYLFFKSRSSPGNRTFGFLSGKQSQYDSKIDNLITLMMLQQLIKPSNHNHHSLKNKKEKEREDTIEKIKKEVLELLEED